MLFDRHVPQIVLFIHWRATLYGVLLHYVRQKVVKYRKRQKLFLFRSLGDFPSMISELATAKILSFSFLSWINLLSFPFIQLNSVGSSTSIFFKTSAFVTFSTHLIRLTRRWHHISIVRVFIDNIASLPRRNSWGYSDASSFVYCDPAVLFLDC